jgi:hypothetical protein
MGSLEFGLQVLVVLEGVLHLLVDQELVRDLQWHEELSCVGPSLQLWELCDEPMQQMLHGLLLTMNNISLERWIEIAGIAKDFKESADSLLGLVLSLTLNIN